jgi:peptide-methionine (S)-S-oxide reductase
VVFYHDDEQRQAAEHYKVELDKAGVYDKPIVTQILPLINFYPAEDDHQNYFQTNPNDEYCTLYVRPKVEKFREVFADKLKPEFVHPQP